MAQPPQPVDINTIINATGLGLSLSDKILPDKKTQAINDVGKGLVNLAKQQKDIAKVQAAATAQQTKSITEGLSILTSQQNSSGRLQATAIEQLAESMKEGLFDVVSQQRVLAGLQGAATMQQTDAIIAQTTSQVQEMTRISSEMGKTNQMLETIATELKTFSKPSVLDQIMCAGALITNSAAVAQIKRLADETARVAGGLDRLADNVWSENSRGDKFPGHVHSFIRSMIEKHEHEKIAHYFFVFNQSTTWHPKFDDIKRADPLGDHFLGYYHDLDVLVAFITSNARPRLGPDPVIHILIPTISQLAIVESLTFPEDMGPFCIDGQLGEGGLPMVYLCTPLEQDRANLSNIGLLRPRRRWVLYQRFGLGIYPLSRWLTVPLDPVYFEEPLYATRTGGDIIVYQCYYTETDPVPPRTVGAPRMGVSTPTSLEEL